MFFFQDPEETPEPVKPESKLQKLERKVSLAYQFFYNF